MIRSRLRSAQSPTPVALRLLQSSWLLFRPLTPIIMIILIISAIIIMLYNNNNMNHENNHNNNIKAKCNISNQK